jgi:hypothetical protein
VLRVVRANTRLTETDEPNGAAPAVVAEAGMPVADAALLGRLPSANALSSC